MNPLITVVIPAYNVRPYIQKCLDTSVLSAQNCFKATGRTVELICVDDGAKDGTGVFLDEYARRHAVDGVTLKIIHQPNGGVSVARNTGLDAATGEWVRFLDADDWVDANLDAQLTARMRETPDVDMIAFEITWLYGSGEIVKRMGADLPPTMLSGDDLLGNTQYAIFAGCVGNRIFKRSVIEQANLRFQPGIQPSEDDLFNMLFLSYNGKVRICSDLKGYCYRMTPDSAVHTMNVKKMMFLVNQFHGLYRRWLEIRTPGLSDMLVRIAKDCVYLGKRADAETRRLCVEALMQSEAFLHEVVPYLLRKGDFASRVFAAIFTTLPNYLSKRLLLYI